MAWAPRAAGAGEKGWGYAMLEGRGRRVVARSATYGPRPVPRKSPFRRACLLATGALCLSLLVGSAGEVWVRIGIERHVTQEQAANMRLRQDTLATARAIATDEAPATIVREARAWGYVACGCQVQASAPAH